MPIDWENAQSTSVRPEALLTTTSAADPSAVEFGAVPSVALDAKKYTAWSRDFEQWILRGQRLTLFSASTLGLISEAGETERDFRIRIQQATRETRDATLQKLRDRYAPKRTRLNDRVRTAQEAVAREQQQVEQQKTQTAVSFGATVLGALLGRKAVSLSTLGRATTAARGVSRSMKEAGDVVRARERLQEAEAQLKELDAELAGELAQLTAADPASVSLDTVEIKPKRGAVDVRLVTLAWK